MNDEPWQVKTIYLPPLSRGQYGIDENGVIIPSVTKLMNPRAFYRSGVAAKGQRIHSQLEGLLNALPFSLTLLDCGDEEIAMIVYRMMMLYKRKLAWREATVTTEVSFICHITNAKENYWYAGTLDLLQNNNYKKMVVDWKSGKPYAWHHQQVAAYMLAVGATEGAIVYRDHIERVEPMNIEQMIGIISSYHANNAHNRGTV